MSIPRRLLAALLLLGSVAAAATFPVIPYYLTAGIIAYGALLYRYPRAWLAILPILLPTVELAPWSGRLLFDAFDMCALTTVAAALWHGSYRRANIQVRSRLAAGMVVLLCVSWLIAAVHGAFPLGPLDGNAMATYYTHYNALRIFKGFLWAALLAPAMGDALRRDAVAAQRLLYVGLTGGLLAVGIVVLWERGVIGDLLQGRGFYRSLGDLLDFTTEYRITALFSEMHTGGAQIDGYLALVWPFTLLPIFLSRQWYFKAAGLLALVLGLYAMTVTFSRDVYGAFAVSSAVLIIGLLSWRPRWLSGPAPLLMILGVAILAILSAFDYKKGGTLAVVAAVTAFVSGAALFADVTRRNMPARLALAGIAALVIGYLAFHAMLTSKWVHNSATAATIDAMVTVLGAGIAGAIFGSTLKEIRRPNMWLAAILVASAVAAGTIVGGGYRMETRFSTVSQDAQTRLDHWRDVVAAMGHGWTAKAIGVGLGRFPYDFLLYTDNSEHLGTYAYQSTPNDGTYLRLGGGGDTEVGQRILLQPNHLYRITARVRTMQDNAALYVGLCEKNILFQRAYQPNCLHPHFKLLRMPGRWQKVAAVVDTGRIARGPWYGRWPSVLLLSNPALGTTLDIDNIEVSDSTNHDLIHNGDFSSGGDRWFSYNDFHHLQWHTKNLLLNIYFEQGLLGITAMAGCLIIALLNAFRRARRGDAHALIAAAGICGFLAVGVFGSLFDSPRLIFLFCLLVWLTLVRADPPMA